MRLTVTIEFSNISDILEARENKISISGVLAGATTQTLYNAPPSPPNNNIYPGPTYSLADVNTRVTFPLPMAYSTSDITPSTITMAAYPQPENYTVQCSSERAATDLCAQPPISVGDILAAEYNLPLFTRPYIEHQPDDPPGSSTGQTQLALSGVIGLGFAQGSESTLFPTLESEALQFNMEVTTSFCNTLPGWFDGGPDNTYPGWFDEELLFLL